MSSFYHRKSYALKCILVAVICLVALATVPPQLAFAGSDLGAAKSFAVLSSSSVTLQNRDNISQVGQPTGTCPGATGCPGSIGGTTVLMGRGNAAAPDTVSGDVIASSDATAGLNCAGNAPGTTAICLGNDSEVAGACATGGGAVSSPSECALGNDASATNPGLAAMAQANLDIVSFSSFLSGQGATQTLAAINLRTNGSTVLSAASGLNVINLPSITTGTNSTITISGPANAFVVVNVGSAEVQGSLNIGNGGSVVLSGGITPDHVVFNLLGDGSVAQLGNGIAFNGTILAPTGQFTSGNGSTTVPNVINGALLFGGTVSIGNNTNLNFFPLAIVIGGGGQS